MAQKVTGYVKLQIPAGQATPAPPVGPGLGQDGVDVAAFAEECYERAKKDMGLFIPVVVTGFVGSANKAIPLTDEEIAALGVEKREVMVSYNVGDNVKITDGALESFIGTVEEIDTERSKVRVVVSMFGRETPVELELDQVEPLN